eukprot:gene22329-30574_t
MPSKKSWPSAASKSAHYGHDYGRYSTASDSHYSHFNRNATATPSVTGASNSLYYVEPQPGYSGPTFYVKYLHLSCTSDPYDPSAPYGCFVLYGNVEGTALQLNGHNILPGYIVIKRTDTAEFESANVGAQGQVHGAVFRLAFNMDLPSNVIGEGFAFMNGAFRYNSATFNAKSDIYSDNDPSMSAPAIDTIKKYLAREWMTISPGGGGGGGGGGGCYLL